MSENEVLGYAK